MFEICLIFCLFQSTNFRLDLNPNSAVEYLTYIVYIRIVTHCIIIYNIFQNRVLLNFSCPLTCPKLEHDQITDVDLFGK